MSVVALCSTDEQTFVDSDFVAHFRCPEQYAGFMLTPADAVRDLRYERYQARERNGLLRQAYYLARPLLPVPVRKHLQRLWFRDWRRIGFPRWPVDSTVEQLFEQMMALALTNHGETEIPFVWFWPDGASSAVIMTHDVETQAGRDFCMRLIDIDESYGITSSFQIVPEDRYKVTSAFLDDIRARGCEVNVHDLNHDGRLFLDRQEFNRRARLINMYARRFNAAGFRSAALYRNLEWLQTLDFSYDMSVPSVGHLEAQRGGCCSVFPFFAGKMVELPLTTTQDYSLFHILRDHSIELWKKQLDLITERHGLASFITHPDYMKSGRPRETYERLLGHLQQVREEKRTWFALPGEVSQWWRDRSRMKVARRGNGWEVLGAGSERARVGFARIEGGRVVYRLQSVLALLVLNGATADAATDSAAAASETFAFPLVALLAAICFCARTEGPIAHAIKRMAKAVLSKTRRWLKSKRAPLSGSLVLGLSQIAAVNTVVLAVAARFFR
jgi:hypothetical protein